VTDPSGAGPRVAVVGVCAAGKSTMVATLRARGVDAYAVSQEHSIVRALWKHQQPDALVLLDATLDTVRRRRDDSDWPAWIYAAQQQRLADARAHADLVLVTDSRDAEALADDVERMLRSRSRPT
jgi:dienelactone hydrolase